MAGRIRSARFHRYSRVAGFGRPSRTAAAHGRYSSRPDSTKKIGTPTCPPLNSQRAPSGFVSAPASAETW